MLFYNKVKPKDLDDASNDSQDLTAVIRNVIAKELEDPTPGMCVRSK
jgi:hypothetical protein